MRITVLTDNNSSGDLGCEWGLSFWIEFRGKKILLDCGQSSLFYENALKLGIDPAEADLAVMSHAHYDHCGGLETFFEVNRGAPVFMRAGTAENCYDRKYQEVCYIGIPHGILKKNAGRFRFISEVTEVLPDARIIPHTPSLEMQDKEKPALLIRRGDEFIPDTFEHEQSLVIDTGEGAVIFSSCSHTGPRNIVKDVQRALNDRRVRAFIGGLHVHRNTPDMVRGLAEDIRAAGIEKLYTGHCTGENFIYLKEKLGEAAEQFYAGMVIGL